MFYAWVAADRGDGAAAQGRRRHIRLKDPIGKLTWGIHKLYFFGLRQVVQFRTNLFSFVFICLRISYVFWTNFKY